MILNLSLFSKVSRFALFHFVCIKGLTSSDAGSNRRNVLASRCSWWVHVFHLNFQELGSFGRLK